MPPSIQIHANIAELTVDMGDAVAQLTLDELLEQLNTQDEDSLHRSMDILTSDYVSNSYSFTAVRKTYR